MPAGFITRTNIKVRLTLCFALIICLMLIGNGLLLWQSHVMQTEASYMNAIEEQFIEVLRVHDFLLSFQKRFNELAESRSVARLQSETPAMRAQLEESLRRTKAVFTSLPADEVLDPTLLPRLEALQARLPSGLEALQALGTVGDWDAIRWRARQQFGPLEEVSWQLVNAVQVDAEKKRAEAAAIVKQTRSRAAYTFGGAAAISLLVAGLLGVGVTRSITAPLRSLVEGSSALARGDFQHRVPVAGRDELAHLAGVFNETTGKLQDLYQELQSRETYLAEAQELSHTGSFGWSVQGDQLFWSDETLRIFGHDPNVETSTLDLLLQRIHPEDEPVVRESIRRVSQDGDELDLEFRIPFENSVKYVRLVAHRVKRNSSEEFAGAVMDITASKLAVREIQVLSDARLSERTRIAQELHDTLLQGVLSASMQLGVADDQLSADSPAKPLIRRVLELMKHVIDEGRDAVSGLRVSKQDLEDLEKGFSRTAAQLSLGGTTEFRVVVDGSRRSLHPAIHDEVYRIVQEAVTNAFRHSGAKSIEVNLVYGAEELRVSVRDDGNGIDSQVLQLGREGHWGLPGMRERAEKIGAKLKVWSSGTTGTEVELRVPGSVAFEPKTGRTSKWSSRMGRRPDGSGEIELKAG